MLSDFFFSGDGARVASIGKGPMKQIHSSDKQGLDEWSKRGPFADTPFEAKVWDAQTGQEIVTVKWIGELFPLSFFSPDGQSLASCSGARGGAVRIWEMPSGRQSLALKYPGGLRAFCFSPDGKRLALVGGDMQQPGATAPGVVSVYDVRSGKEELTLKGELTVFGSVNFSPDGTRLAAVEDACLPKAAGDAALLPREGVGCAFRPGIVESIGWGLRLQKRMLQS